MFFLNKILSLDHLSSTLGLKPSCVACLAHNSHIYLRRAQLIEHHKIIKRKNGR
jgi:hypothetical protein